MEAPAPHKVYLRHLANLKLESQNSLRAISLPSRKEVAGKLEAPHFTMPFLTLAHDFFPVFA